MSAGGLGGLWLLARRSLRQHALSTALTAACAALSVGLVAAVFSLQAQSRAAFTGGQPGFDAVLGARGSQLQLVLNAVYHLETSPGNIPWRYYQALKADPRVALALPYAVGDNYRGWRLVGTDTALFTDFEPQAGQGLRFAQGRAFYPLAREAVAGSFAARALGLRLGQRIHAYHGLVFDPAQRHDGDFEVVGLLEPTGTPMDRVIWIPLEGFYRLDGHVLRGNEARRDYRPQAGQAIPDEHKELSAVLLRFRDPQHALRLSHMINQQGTVATLAWPIGAVMAELFDKLGWAHRVLLLVGLAVMLLSAAATLAALTNTLEARRRDFAILRALGAPRRTVAGLMVLESATCGALGGLAGLGVQAGLLHIAAGILRAQTGVLVSPWAWHPALLWAPLGMTLLCALAGLVPAWRAYHQDVGQGLQSQT